LWYFKVVLLRALFFVAGAIDPWQAEYQLFYKLGIFSQLYFSRNFQQNRPQTEKYMQTNASRRQESA
jgi:hypothetical protein